jgi:jumonji domain-containing protein 7
MKFSDFLPLLEDADITHNDARSFVDTKREPAGVPYCQHQNGSFAEEFKVLHSDAALDLPFATEAIGAKPDAVNFWMGDGRSTTTMHQDPYENLYAVVRGEKVFSLVPPCDAYFLDRREFPCARWRRDPDGWEEAKRRKEAGETEPEDAPIDRTECDNNDFAFFREKRKAVLEAAEKASIENAEDVEIINTPYQGETAPVDPSRMVRKGPFVTEPVEGTVPWIDLDVDTSPLFYPPGTRRARLMRAYKNINKYIVSVKAGQVLYLPSLWFHAVRQKGKTIAVNYWYDMSYDVRFLHVEFMNQIAAMKQKEYEKSKETSNDSGMTPSDVRQ